MAMLLLSGCLLLMDRPPKCPDECPGNFECKSNGICPTSCFMDPDAECMEGYHCDIYSEKCKPGSDTGFTTTTDTSY